MGGMEEIGGLYRSFPNSGAKSTSLGKMREKEELREGDNLGPLSVSSEWSIQRANIAGLRADLFKVLEVRVSDGVVKGGSSSGRMCSDGALWTQSPPDELAPSMSPLL